MNIKDYKLFLEKDINIRDDEHSHLNDRLNSRWDDSTYDPYDEEYYDDDDYYHQNNDDDDDGIEEDDMEHLLYLLRSMFKNSGIDVRVSNKEMNINIFIQLTPRERLKRVITIFEVVNKLKKDILIQYSCEFEMWETKMGMPYLEFTFYYEDEDNTDDGYPF
jgi:hypothetical protein